MCSQFVSLSRGIPFVISVRANRTNSALTHGDLACAVRLESRGAAMSASKDGAGRGGQLSGGSAAGVGEAAGGLGGAKAHMLQSCRTDDYTALPRNSLAARVARDTRQRAPEGPAADGPFCQAAAAHEAPPHVASLAEARPPHLCISASLWPSCCPR